MPHVICSIVVMLTLAVAAHADEECSGGSGGSAKLQQCVKARCQAKKACTAAIASAVKSSNDAAGATGAAFKAKADAGETAIKDPAAVSSKLQNGTSQLLQDAMNSCDKQETDECKAKCVPSGSTQKEGDQIKKEREGCKQDIKKLKDDAAAGKVGADKASDGSKDTDKQSGGQAAPQAPQSQDKDKDKDDSKDSSSPASTPPSMPTPSPSPDTQSSGSTASAITPAGGVSPANGCADLQTKCVTDLKAQCAKSSSDLCTQFTNRYCGKNGVTGGMEGADDIKAGSGAGDEYCTADTAKSFCDVGGRDSCDSCRKLRNLPPLPANEQASACGIDPSSLPTLQKTGSSSAMGMASVGGSGGSSGGSGAGAAAAATPGTNAVKENPYDKLRESMNMTAEGSGGGSSNTGGGGDPGADTTLADLASGYGIIGRTPAQVAGDAMRAATVNATDIAVGGPRVFKLVEDVYLARCAAKKYNNCPPRP